MRKPAEETTTERILKILLFKQESVITCSCMFEEKQILTAFKRTINNIFNYLIPYQNVLLCIYGINKLMILPVVV